MNHLNNIAAKLPEYGLDAMLITSEAGERYAVGYDQLGTAVAIVGIKELYARFRPVENKVKALEGRVRNLQARLDNAYREIFILKEGKEEVA